MCGALKAGESGVSPAVLCWGVVLWVGVGYVGAMNASESFNRGLRRGVGALMFGVVCLVLLLVGAVSAQAQDSRSSKDPIDFVFDVRADSASFTPIVGTPGLYKLVLRGVPQQVGVHELNRARRKHQFSVTHMMRYWTLYGDKTGQFESDPPYAVVRGSGAQQGDAVVVKLREGSRKGSTLTFEAEVETRSQVLRLLKSKIGKTVERQIGSLTHVKKPEAMTDVAVHIDIPKTLTPPAQTAAKSMLRTAKPSMRAMTCNGNYSSQLVMCWQDMNCENSAGMTAGKPNGPFGYDSIGLVTLGDWWFPLAIPSATQYDRGGCIEYLGIGQYYGVNWRDAVTYYATLECSYFLAKWSGLGKCY